ncbi:DUF4258 domain-containing protein [Membranihabitans maritimus]|uniref:DUF4258 domain-containing protein n=1 Tax=Membranihabitans maritimus TaxID=2904244 RepID=UPI001F362C16|nr:DUF4258 domain-containing protein [Membranihabitans maritimus]
MDTVYFTCKELTYSDHAVIQMFKRNISTEEIDKIIKFGEIIADYPNDKPFPSCLLLGIVNSRPLHVVIAINKKENSCVIITAYKPDPNIWDDSFKSKIQ